MPQAAKFHFAGYAGSPTGFRSSAVSHFNAQSYAILTREIIQNSLDAGARTVTFRDESITSDELPDLSGLKAHLNAAIARAKREGTYKLNKAEMDDMHSCIAGKDDVPILWASDDGKGWGRMDCGLCLATAPAESGRRTWPAPTETGTSRRLPCRDCAASSTERGRSRAGCLAQGKFFWRTMY